MVEDLYRSIVDQFAQAHIGDATGQINFTRFLKSLYDLDEDPIFKDWLNHADAEVVDVMTGGFSQVDQQDEERSHSRASHSATLNDANSVAATAGSSPTGAHRCVQLNVIDILSTFENRILGDAILKASSAALEASLTSALEQHVAKLEAENLALKERLAGTIKEALEGYQTKVRQEVASLCHNIVMQNDNNERAAQTKEWRGCKQVLEELIFED